MAFRLHFLEVFGCTGGGGRVLSVRKRNEEEKKHRGKTHPRVRRLETSQSFRLESFRKLSCFSPPSSRVLEGVEVGSRDSGVTRRGFSFNLSADLLSHLTPVFWR